MPATAGRAGRWPRPARAAYLVVCRVARTKTWRSRSGEVRAWLAILVKTEVTPSLGRLREVALDAERQLCRLVVSELSGHAYPTSPIGWPSALEYAAVDLHAWIDGLCLQAASSRQLMPPDAARSALRRYLRQLADTVAQGTT